MIYKRISGKTQEGSEIMSVGDLFEINGVTYLIEEVNTYKDDYDEVHNVDYTLKRVEITAEEIQELQQL